ncbi:unnamed protein product, partial [Amoebophrya sp. A120]
KNYAIYSRPGGPAMRSSRADGDNVFSGRRMNKKRKTKKIIKSKARRFPASVNAFPAWLHSKFHKRSEVIANWGRLAKQISFLWNYRYAWMHWKFHPDIKTPSSASVSEEEIYNEDKELFSDRARPKGKLHSTSRPSPSLTFKKINKLDLLKRPDEQPVHWSALDSEFQQRQWRDAFRTVPDHARSPKTRNRKTPRSSRPASPFRNEDRSRSPALRSSSPDRYQGLQSLHADRGHPHRQQRKQKLEETLRQGAGGAPEPSKNGRSSGSTSKAENQDRAMASSGRVASRAINGSTVN